MATSNPAKPSLMTAQHVFRLFKYTIYLLLSYNAFLFFQEDLAASAQTFGGDITWRNVVEAYSATFDTAAWVILLLLFELETAVIPDHLLKGRLKWLLKGLAAVCYAVIVYSFYGYWIKYGMVTDVLPFMIDDVCGLIGTDFTWVFDLDDYYPIDETACTALNNQALFQISGTRIIATQPALTEATRLAMVDVVNALTWLIVVALLEIEVFLQLWDRLTERLMTTAKYVKGLFYAVLFVCAAYWGFKGSFLDFWDAFLWLVAFIFIELNIFQWHAESEEEREHVLKV